MRNYKDETITKLCQIINYLDDNYCLTEEDVAEYKTVMADYAAEYATEEVLDEVIPSDCSYYNNCYILRCREDGEVMVKAYDKEKSEVMMRNVSKLICFSDCDDTWEVIKIVYHGREVEYAGWRPCMEMAYYYAESGDPAWKEFFPSWDH